MLDVDRGKDMRQEMERASNQLVISKESPEYPMERHGETEKEGTPAIKMSNCLFESHLSITNHMWRPMRYTSRSSPFLVPSRGAADADFDAG